jgi:hypothetical protein
MPIGMMEAYEVPELSLNLSHAKSRFQPAMNIAAGALAPSCASVTIARQSTFRNAATAAIAQLLQTESLPTQKHSRTQQDASPVKRAVVCA